MRTRDYDPGMDDAIRAAFTAGQTAPRDEDGAVDLLLSYCRTHGCRPGDPVADAWVLGWNEAAPSA